MERIQKPDTAYEDDSKRDPVGTPRFTAGSARKARQVVALRPRLWRPINQVWASLGTGGHRTRLLAAIALVALAGGIAGGLLAGAQNDPETGVDAGSLTAGAEARSQTESSQPVSMPKVEQGTTRSGDPANTFAGPEIERAVTQLRNRRSSSRARKAYRVAVIYPGDYGPGRKRIRKH